MAPATLEARCLTPGFPYLCGWVHEVGLWYWCAFDVNARPIACSPPHQGQSIEDSLLDVASFILRNPQCFGNKAIAGLVACTTYQSGGAALLVWGESGVAAAYGIVEGCSNLQ